MGVIRVSTAVAGAPVLLSVLMFSLPQNQPTPLLAGVIASGCLLAAGSAAIAARYLGQIDALELPEAPALCQGARLVAWVLGLAALSIGLVWAEQQTALRVLYLVLFVINAALCYGLLVQRQPAGRVQESFPLDLGVLSVLGSRTNILASILDAAERQLGIDLRSTWALTVVRRSLEPLVIGLCLIGWLSTSLTVVGIEEQGLVERLGVPVGGQALLPGLHMHWPWPIDRVFRIPVRRVQALTVGHEGEEAGGPENVLWAGEHAANEYTLLLGNGRDLITVDAAVQFRIADARAWRYHCQNPADALRAIAYRAVMRIHREPHAFRGLVGERRDVDGAACAPWCSRMPTRSAWASRSGVHGRRHASAGAGGCRLRGGGLRGTREGHRGRQCPGLPQSDRARGRGFRL